MMPIRPPLPTDYPQIAELVNLAQDHYHTVLTPKEFAAYNYSTETIEDLRAGEERRHYLCFYDPSGGIYGFVSFRLKNPQTVRLSTIAVSPTLQKSWIGTKLLLAVEKFWKENQAQVLVLETDQRATRAVAFYQKNGYNILSDEALQRYPFDQVLDQPQVPGRYIFWKILD